MGKTVQSKRSSSSGAKSSTQKAKKSLIAKAAKTSPKDSTKKAIKTPKSQFKKEVTLFRDQKDNFVIDEKYAKL